MAFSFCPNNSQLKFLSASAISSLELVEILVFRSLIFFNGIWTLLNICTDKFLLALLSDLDEKGGAFSD
ncbi:hypothetical protein G4B88_006008 [Cannabis sativa]|uniref:Uncharacterized protein n=1 Tax=Cannabis sativa TaxID=3483 RepID=A0A7J6IAJ3_CANSA|nr:hypothetical protein G4B88_006008 [Cannabis sativa]